MLPSVLGDGRCLMVPGVAVHLPKAAATEVADRLGCPWEDTDLRIFEDFGSSDETRDQKTLGFKGG
jgi:hypothetical protein